MKSLPMKHLLCVAILLSILPSMAFAFAEQDYSEDQWAQMQQQTQPLQVTSDAISWDIFGQTKSEQICTVDEDGYDFCYDNPTYPETLKALNGKEVILMGYMFPLETTPIHSNFLFGPYPLSCPFHYHVGPKLVVEINAYTPIDFSYDPIKLKGILRVELNKETDVFYYLDKAEEIY